jgi:dolichol-phosphate mannosyltransferase
MRCIVIIPTYNEAGNIKEAIEQVLEMDIPGLEVLVVDDESPDGTSSVVKKIRNRKVHLLSNGKKRGLGYAYLKGMEYATGSLHADILIEMDADLSHSARYLPELLRQVKRFDIVLGSRYIKGGEIPKEWGLHRKILSRCGNRIISFLLGPSIRDWSTGYRAIRSEVYCKINHMVDEEMLSGYAFQIGFLHKARKSGFSVTEIPIVFKDRSIGKSKLGLEYIINTLRYILKSKLGR